MIKPNASSADNGHVRGLKSHLHNHVSASGHHFNPASSVIAVAVAASMAFSPCGAAFAAAPLTAELIGDAESAIELDGSAGGTESTKFTSDIDNSVIARDASSEPSTISDDATVPGSTMVPDVADGVEGEAVDDSASQGDPAVVAALEAAGIVVEGGIAGIDYTFENVTYTRIGRGYNEAGTQDGRSIQVAGEASVTVESIVIKTDGSYTISSKDVVSAGIKVEAGVHADITLAGFNTTSLFPFNIETNSTLNQYDTVEVDAEDIENPTTVNLYIAAGTTNSLKSTQAQQFPGLRCGEGSILTIDSTVSGSEQGSLTVIGGLRAAAIGGGPVEDAGVITINGGTIESKAYGQNESENLYGAGTGIGGGHAGGGTIININGGRVSAYGSYHGAGIGGGCTYNGGMSRSIVSYPLRDALLSRHASSTLAGDITITGGYITSKGEIHSNAFGQGCGGTNTGHIIRITGGTLLPDAKACTSGFNAIGGAGGYTIITGGSVNCIRSQFSGIGNTAYNTLGVESWDDVVALGGSLPEEDQVFMTTIDLSGEGLKNDAIVEWDLYISNQKVNYGAPSYFDNGKLYLWLPKTAVGKEVRVSLKADNGSEEITPGDLFIDKVQENGNSLLKRFVDFEFPTEWAQENLYKSYDGTPFSGCDSVLHTPEESNPKPLNPEYMKYTHQLYDADGELVGESKENLPSDSGHYQLVMTSSQYSSDPEFAASYWGHRAYGECEITPVDSKITDFDVQWDDDGRALSISANIMGADEDVPTYKYPQGSIQVLVDGVPAGDAVDLVFDKSTSGFDSDTNTSSDKNEINAERVYLDTYAAGTSEVDKGSYTKFEYEFDTAELQRLFPTASKDGAHKISIQYVPSKNYLVSTSVDAKDITIKPVDSNATFLPSDNISINASDGNQGSGSTGGSGSSGSTGNSGNKVVTGTISTNSVDPIELKLKNPSIEDLVVESNGILCEADFIRDENGNPVKDKDGNYTLVVDPQAVGNGKLTVTQGGNGVYTGTTFEFDVSTKSDADVKADVSVTNKTHPNGPTSKGDVLEYTVEITNGNLNDLQNVLIENGLPPTLTVNTSSIQVSGATGNFVPGGADGEELKPGEFTITEDNKLIVNVGSVAGANGDNDGDGNDDNKVTVTFKVTVNSVPESENDLTDIVKVTGTDSKSNTTVSSDPTIPDALPGGINSNPSGSNRPGTGSSNDGSDADDSDGDNPDADAPASDGIQINPDVFVTVDGKPGILVEDDKPLNIFDVIHIMKEDGTEWTDWKTEIANPSNPGGSSNPGSPSNPGGSTDPDNPDNPNDPSNPNNPNNPGNSGNPDNPDDPSNPSGPNDPGNTDNLPPYKVTVKDENGNEVDPNNITEAGSYTITVEALNPETNDYDENIFTYTFDVHKVSSYLLYTDVPYGFWGYDYIYDISPKEVNGKTNPSKTALDYMQGYDGTTLFGTQDNIIRGDAAMLIWRMAGKPAVTQTQFADGTVGYVTGFDDCDTQDKRDMYYNEAIAWCSQANIIEGYAGTGEFRANNNITREEFAAMLTRYASYKGTNTSVTSDLGMYPDSELISDWALGAMHYVTSSGIMTGKGTDEGTALGTHGILDPQANVTRAEVAKMIYVEQPVRL